MAGNILIWQMIIKFVLLMMLVFGLVGIALGAGLIGASASTVRFLRSMDRWVSFRSALKPVEIPRDTGQFAHRHRRALGACLVIGGLFSAFGLATRIKVTAAAALFSNGPMAPMVAIAAETVKWFLVVGSAAGLVVGLMLFLYPNGLSAFEGHANRWVSTRQAARGADELRLPLDKLVEAHPKLAGWLFACTALGMVIYAATLLFTGV